MLRRLARTVTLASGLKRAGFAFAAGALGALAMPPFGAFPALCLSLPILILLIDGSAASGLVRTVLSATLVGWWFGFGYHLAGLWWIGAAFLVEADRFAWALPIAVTALPAGLALFMGFGAGLARILWRSGPGRVVALAVGLTVAEYLRSVLLTGFPWNLIGTALTQHLWLAQAAAYVGTHGLTFLTVLTLATPALLADPADEKGAGPAIPIAAALGLGCLALLGAWRMSATPVTMVPDVRLRLVQPNIPQDERFRPEARDWVLKRYSDLSDRATSPERMGVKDVTHVIWPESAFPFFLIQDREALAAIAALLPQGVTLITGAARPDAPRPGRREPQVFNSAYVIDHQGVITTTYDKVHLVPFGEYLPFHDALEAMGLEAVTRVRGGFSAGDRRRTLAISGAPPVGILICYEIIFPGAATAPDRRPGWLLNLTNDAWFGHTPGPYQHLHMAAARAIEEGLPVVRAANSGVSAVIDPLGRMLRFAPLGVMATLDADLPAALPRTLYATTGDAPLALALAVAIAALLRRRKISSFP